MNNFLEDFLFENKEEALAYEIGGVIDKIRIGHDYFDAAIQGIKDCMKESHYSREPASCMLLGEGGSGKTTIAKMFMSWLKPEVIIENDMEISTVPAFFTSFKGIQGLDALTQEMLIQLGDPNPSLGKLKEKATRVINLLIKCRTVIVFVDELHDLEKITVRGGKEWEQFMKWIKALCNGCGPMICLMGTPVCHEIFKGDPEMERRFKPKFFLRWLSPGTPEEPGLLQPFLSDLCQEVVNRTPIESFPNVGLYENALRIYAATSGSLDFIMTLVKKSVVMALLANRKDVEIGDFAAVWDSGVLNSTSITRFNPFLSSQDQIVAAIRKKMA